MATLLTERIRSLVLSACVRGDVEIERAGAIADQTVRAMCQQLGGRSLWLPVSVDAGHAVRAQATTTRYREWQRLRAEGMKPTEIARRFNVSRVSVWRGLSKVSTDATTAQPDRGDNAGP